MMTIKMPELPVHIPADKIGLPTSGAVIEKCTSMKAGEPRKGGVAEAFQLTAETDMIVLEGKVLPVDPEAQSIGFELGIPMNWNGKLIQAGGAGLDGYVIPCSFPMTGQDAEKSAMKQGYAVLGSDGGHTMETIEYWSSRWALNRETLVNFAYEQLKKVRDTACALLETVAGRLPDKVYFYGGSNGGRECLKAIQNFPSDYDGAICFFPVLNWVLKLLLDCAIADKVEEVGQPGFIDDALQEKIKRLVLEKCDGLDGVEDGLISDLPAASLQKEELYKTLRELLSPEQFEVVRAVSQPLALPFDLPCGYGTLDGYQIYDGSPVGMHLNLTPEARAASMAASGDDFIRCGIFGDPSFEVRHLDTAKWEKELVAASELLDANTTDLDGFFQKGGKLLLAQGGSDPLVSVQWTNDYYKRLLSRYGQQQLDAVMRYYVVPGFGHGPGGDFLLSTDMIGALDGWVSEGAAPHDLIAGDALSGRTRPLCEYPAYPRYAGEGDVNKADSFRKEGGR